MEGYLIMFRIIIFLSLIGEFIFSSWLIIGGISIVYVIFFFCIILEIVLVRMVREELLKEWVVMILVLLFIIFYSGYLVFYENFWLLENIILVVFCGNFKGVLVGYYYDSVMRMWDSFWYFYVVRR